MAVMVIGVVPIVRPLLKLSVLADSDRAGDDPAHQRVSRELLLAAQQRRSLDAVGEEVTDQRNVHCRRRADRGTLTVGCGELVFGRGGGRGNQHAVVFDQPIQAELSRTLHQWVGALGQECAVAAKRVVLPQVLTEPRASHRPAGPHRVTGAKLAAHWRTLPPEIGVVVGDPTVLCCSSSAPFVGR